MRLRVCHDHDDESVTVEIGDVPHDHAPSADASALTEGAKKRIVQLAEKGLPPKRIHAVLVVRVTCSSRRTCRFSVSSLHHARTLSKYATMRGARDRKMMAEGLRTTSSRSVAIRAPVSPLVTQVLGQEAVRFSRTTTSRLPSLDSGGKSLALSLRLKT